MQQFTDGLAYIVDVSRLGKEFRPSAFRDLRMDLILRSFAAHEKDRDIDGGLIAPERFKKMRAGRSGHVIVEQDEIGVELPGLFQTGNGFCGPVHFITRGFQRLRNDLDQVGIVVYDKNSSHQHQYMIRPQLGQATER